MIHPVRPRPSIATVSLALLLMALPLAGTANAGSQPQPEPPSGVSTPELLDRAVARGEIDRDTANLYLSYALSSEHELVPDRYVGGEPWHGTLPLLELRQDVTAGRAGRHASRISSVLGPERAAAAAECGDDVGGSNRRQSDHFVIDYGQIYGGLTIDDYAQSLDAAWDSEVGAFGWAAPPTDPTAPGDKYHVVVADLGSGLYGYVTTAGDFAGLKGNNPNTPWNEGDAYISCMVLNRNYSGFPGNSLQALDATTAHEFNHSIQFGYGANTGNESGTVADEVFVEGGATWMEDEVVDGSNDNQNYLWPNLIRDMGTYSEGAGALSPYPYWVVFRAMTEQYGAGVAGGAEDVFQRYWEAVSKGDSEDLVAMNDALVAEGTNLANAYHAAAIALRFNVACSGGYVPPYCLEEGPDYVAAAGSPPFQGTIASIGDDVMGSLPDNYSLNWIRLPATGTYDVILENTSSGGQLRASVACDTGTAISVSPFPAVAGSGVTRTLPDFDAGACTDGTEFAVITNQKQTAADPGSSPVRSYSLSTAPQGGPTVSIGDTSQVEGGNVVFPLTLSEQVGAEVTVEYTTADDTAVQPGDYTSQTSTVTFSAGSTDQTLAVPTVEDTEIEDDETFFVNLTSVTTMNATIADGQGVGTIVDDEVEPTCPGYGSDPRNQVVGTPAANTLNGTGGADIICGLGGGDTIDGLGGNDLLLGGDGTDTLTGGPGADTLNGGDGNDGSNRSSGAGWFVIGLFGEAGNDRLIGGNGADDLIGGPGTDRLEGGAAWDVLLGMDGADTLLAGAGNDEVLGNAGNDTKNGGPGFDIAEYLNEAGPLTANLSTKRASGTGIGTDTLVSVEDLIGTDRADTMTGNGGGNFMYGLGGNDRLIGLGGHDALFGLAGNDTFDGGPGTDRCVQGAGSGARTACEFFSKVMGPAGRSPAGHLAPRLLVP